jgi:hypothetical protein
MEAGFIALAILMLVVGVVVGMLVGKTRAERRYAKDTQYTQGTLNIDCSEPEFEPGLFLGLAIPVKDVVSRKYIMLDVNVMLQDSHK